MNAIRSILLTALVAPLAMPVLAATHDDCDEDVAGSPGLVCVRSDVRYVKGGDGEQQVLDVYYRPDNPNAKVVVFVPGGGWMQVDKGLYTALGNSLTGQHDLTTVIINYRVSTPPGSAAQRSRRGAAKPVRHPDHVRDVAAAIGFVKREMGAAGALAGLGDAQRLYLFGQSAGAHLVSLLATDPTWLGEADCGASGACSLDDIRGVISMSGMYDLPALTSEVDEVGLDGAQSAAIQTAYRIMVSNAFGPDEARWAEGSPQTWIESYINGDLPTPALPPILLLYSASDMPRLANEAHAVSLTLDTLFDATANDDAAAARAIDDPTSTEEPNGPPQHNPNDLPEPLHASTAPAAPTVELRRIERIDYSQETWCASLAMAGKVEEAFLGDCSEPLTEEQTAAMNPFAVAAGHWAEVYTINPGEPESYTTRLVVDFIATH